MTNLPPVGTKHIYRLSNTEHKVRVQGYYGDFVFLALLDEEFRDIPVSDRLIKVRIELWKI